MAAGCGGCVQARDLELMQEADVIVSYRLGTNNETLVRRKRVLPYIIRFGSHTYPKHTRYIRKKIFRPNNWTTVSLVFVLAAFLYHFFFCL